MRSTGNDFMQIQQLAAEAVPGRLESSAEGISAAEAMQRLRRYGPNRIEKLARVPWGLRLLGEFVQFFSVILWIAAALAFVAEWSAPGQGMAWRGSAMPLSA
jgi:magnesium-transporting ATPase (P-type)